MSDIYSVSEPNAPPPDNGFDALEALRGIRLTPVGATLDLFLIALIVIGIYFRFNWANWNQDTDLHPDEYGLTSTLTQLAVPKSIGDYFNTRLSPLSPYQKYDRAGNPLEPSAENRMPDNRMRWGQWPIIIIRWTAELTDNTGYGDLRLWGRKLSALFDSLSLAVIFLFGWRLYRNYRIGLLAAALSALAVMQIQQSHFMTADNFATLFTALAMLCAAFVARPPKIDGWFGLPSVWYALFGVFFGMALASRINLLPLFGLILVAAVIAYAERWEKGDRAKVVSEVLLRLALAGVVALLTFRITSPMSFRARTGDTTFLTFTPNKEWVESMALASAESSGASPGGPPGEQWTNRPAIIFPLVNMVVWGMGLPLGLLAWAGFLWALWRAVRPGDEWKAHALPLVWAGGYFLFMGTRWVKSVRYFLSIYPFLALFSAWAVFELWRLAESRKQKTENSRSVSFFILPTSVFLIVTLGTLAWAWGFTSIYRTDNTRIQASRWIYQNVPAAINLHFQQADGQLYNDPISGLDGTVFDAADPVSFPFRARVTGTLTGLSFAHIRNANDGTLDAMMHVSVSRDADGAQILAEGDVPVGVVGRDPRGDAAQTIFGPTAVTAGETYYLRLSVAQGGAAQITSSMLAIESWDEGLPLRLDNRDAYGGLYRGLIMEVRWGDDEHKQQMFLDDLAQVDYVVLPSQRAVWSSGRLPNNYPLTMEYYRALFDGRLGFDLVKQFQSPFILGPLQASDVAGTFAWGQTPPLPPPGKDFPFNNNWLAAEEAFSVYDHAPVWVFRKRADFDIENARALLNAIDLSTVVNQDPVSATKAPTLLMLPADRLAEQQAGGTWRDMFNPQSWLNQHEWLGVIVWWLAIMLLGWLAFPLTHAAFGGLADRGYALSRTVALVVVAWLAWILGSFRLLPFTQLTIALCVLALALVSGFIAWRREDELRAFIREQRRHILTVEAILLALFLFDLFIRWGNPDLWHPNFGGERPMVFSFFNAVLKSTAFPPYNPWMSGAFLNYYYYGFVIVSVPVKLLGIVPSFAFNLILPTLFALTGINAFGIAYNLVRSQKSEVGSQKLEVASEAMAEMPLTSDLRPPTSNLSLPAKPNPYLAGIAAALLVVVLGNLGQVYTLMGGFEKAGDRAAFAGTPIGSGELSAILDGAAKVFSGKAVIPIGTGDWYWTASRVVGYINKSSDITEFPFFTFLYSDLHAHMIDMPLALLALAWAVSYLLDKRPKRWPIESMALWAIGGLALGVTNPTNTWDFPTYLGLGLVAVVAAHFLRSARLTRASLFALAWRLALLLGLAVGLYRPFEQWFAPAYSAFKRNLDTYATNSGYLYMFGLFLFILVAFLMWETRRWLAETPATVVTRAGDWLPWLALVLAAVVVSVAALWFLHVQIGLIVLPLMAWAGLLLLRPPSAMPAEKQAILFLTGTALAVTLFVELFLVGGDRMNTIFKFYIQAWLLFSVAGGAALALVWAALPQWPGFWRSAWQVGLSLLVAAAALYTVTAANAKIHDRYPQYTAQPTGIENPGCQQIPGVPMPPTYTNDQSWAVKDQPHTLDSAAYMTWSAYCDNTYFVPLAYDADAIHWMQKNVDGSPTILEANVPEYRWGNRFTIYTGLPGVVGWSYHTRQHRGIVSTVMVTDRVDEVREFYCTPTLTGGIVGDTINLPELCRIPVDYATIDYNWAVNFLQKYDVRYVIVGAYERALFPAEGLQKFDVLQARGVLTPVYQNPGTVIYQVNGN